MRAARLPFVGLASGLACGMVAALFAGGSVQADAPDITPVTCVASLVGSPGFNAHLQRAAVSRLMEMGLGGEGVTAASVAGKRFVYRADGLRGLRECLQGDYEDVTLVAHASPSPTPGHALLRYAVLVGQRRTTVPVSPQFFRSFRPSGQWALGRRLRQITVITCMAEGVLKGNPELAGLARDYNLHLKLQPIDGLASRVSGRKGLRTPQLIPWMIAENAQPAPGVGVSERVFCVMPQTTQLLGEHGRATCLRGRYQLRLDNPLAFGWRSSNAILQFNPGRPRARFFALEAEAAAGNSAVLSTAPRARRSLVHATSYGLGISLFKRVSIRETGHEPRHEDYRYERELQVED